MKDQKQNLAIFNALMQDVLPILNACAPVKQRAVLEVLSRKSMGISIDMSCGDKDGRGYAEIGAEFHFDVGDPVIMNFILDPDEFYYTRGLLVSRVLFKMYVDINTAVGLSLKAHNPIQEQVVGFEFIDANDISQPKNRFTVRVFDVDIPTKVNEQTFHIERYSLETETE